MSSITEMIDVFFNGRPASPGFPLAGGINRKCPKCGVPLARMQYDQTFDRIDLKCQECDYTWSQKPVTPNPEGGK